MEEIINKENTGVYFPLSNTALKQTGKKNVLGKLDNLIHQTPGITPFKSSQSVKVEGSNVKLSIRKPAQQNVSKDREEVNEKTTSCFLGSYMVRRGALQPINLFNYTDFPTERCVQKCSKPITVTWQENESDYDDLCERILHGIHALEEDWENGEIPQLCTDFDQSLPLIDINIVESEEYEPSLFDLPLPSFINVDILF